MSKPKIEQKIDTAVKPVVKELAAMEAFTENHPRSAKAVVITAIVAVTMGGLVGWKAHSLKSNIAA